MCRRIGIVPTSVLIFALAAKAGAQQVRGEVSLTTERQGISINSDVRYYQPKNHFFALARIFINEPDGSMKQPTANAASLEIEAAAGRSFNRRALMLGPLLGFDSEKRVLAGASLVARLRGHSIAYLGYVRVATSSEHTNGTRHRLLFDLKKHEKLFLRLDWKTEGNRQEHNRLGMEFDTRIDKLNLPVYVEPFWDFPARRPGIRLGIKL